MFKSIASLFGSLGWMVLRVILTIASLVCMVIFAIKAFDGALPPFQRALWLLAAIACVALFAVLVRTRKKEDETPVEDERDRFS